MLLDAATEVYIQFAALRRRIRPVSACGRAYAADRPPFVRGQEPEWQADHEHAQQLCACPDVVDACGALFAQLPEIERFLGGLRHGVLTQEGLVTTAAFCRIASRVDGVLAAQHLAFPWWSGEAASAVLLALGLPLPPAADGADARAQAGLQAGASAGAFSLDELPDEPWRDLRAQLERVRVQRLRAESAVAARLRAMYRDGAWSRDGALIFPRRAEPLAAADDPRLRQRLQTPAESVFDVVWPDDVADLRVREEAVSRQLSEVFDGLLRRVGRALLPHVEHLESLVQAVGRLDELCARVRLSREQGYAWSELDAAAVALEGGLLPDFPDFTPLDLALDRRISILTGPNMGGKTVAQKTLSFALACHHYGCPVRARGLRAPLFGALRCIGGDDQSLGAGLSSFGAELVRIREALEQQSLFLCLDEPARATNPEEGGALVAALTAVFAGREDAWLFLATHFRVAEPHALRLQIVGISAGWFDEEAGAVAPAAHAPAAVSGPPAAAANAIGGPQTLDDRLQSLARAMDYRIVPADAADPPRTGLAVARWLGLPETVVQLAERILDGGGPDGR